MAPPLLWHSAKIEDLIEDLAESQGRKISIRGERIDAPVGFEFGFFRNLMIFLNPSAAGRGIIAAAGPRSFLEGRIDGGWLGWR